MLAYYFHIVLSIQIEKWHKKNGSEGGGVRRSGFLSFCNVMDVPAGEHMIEVPGRRHRDVKQCYMWNSLSEKERKR